MFDNWSVDGAKDAFMKTGCINKISQISGFQSHLLRKILLAYFYLSEIIQKIQFAVTDPVGI